MLIKRKIRLINDLLDLWEEKTEFSSSISETRHYENFCQILLKVDKSIVILTILNRIKRKKSWAFNFLFSPKIISKKNQPKIPYEDYGYMNRLRKIWIEWGEKEGYLK
jgi:hypothetical protein